MIEWVITDAQGYEVGVRSPTELQAWKRFLGLIDGGDLSVLVDIVNGLKGAGYKAEQVWRQKH